MDKEDENEENFDEDEDVVFDYTELKTDPL
jgi:hypothetical protein